MIFLRRAETHALHCAAMHDQTAVIGYLVGGRGQHRPVRVAVRLGAFKQSR